jgi:Uma2 family endonuclease
MTERTQLIDLPKTLVEGEYLDQPTFHALYEAMPPGTRAELIGGVVSMPSPVGWPHGRAQVSAIVWLSYYEDKTPGVETLGNATSILGRQSEPEPDCLLRIQTESGGHSTVEQNLIHGAPELVVEIAKASRYIDLGPKRADYERAGVLEYIVRAHDPDEVIWFHQDRGSFKRVQPDPDGLYRSLVFPGLWLDPEALLRSDHDRLRAVLDLGLATPEHAAFVARLTQARGSHG